MTGYAESANRTCRWGSDVEALRCGHIFHTKCIGGYMEATGKTYATCCIYKCHQSVVAVDTLNAGNSASDEDDEAPASDGAASQGAAAVLSATSAMYS